jgi:hypothetical protein
MIGAVVQLNGRDSRIVPLVQLRLEGNVRTAGIWNPPAFAAEQQYGSELTSRIVDKEVQANAERLCLSVEESGRQFFLGPCALRLLLFLRSVFRNRFNQPCTVVLGVSYFIAHAPGLQIDGLTGFEE